MQKNMNTAILSIIIVINVYIMTVTRDVCCFGLIEIQSCRLISVAGSIRSVRPSICERTSGNDLIRADTSAFLIMTDESPLPSCTQKNGHDRHVVVRSRRTIVADGCRVGRPRGRQGPLTTLTRRSADIRTI